MADPRSPQRRPRSALEEGIIFAVKKFLEHARVIEGQEKILEREVEDLTRHIKKQTVQHYIAKLNTYD